jgi:hypothetical protein
MRPVVVLAEAAQDLAEARRFYDAREPGVGDYCLTSLLVWVRPPPATPAELFSYFQSCFSRNTTSTRQMMIGLPASMDSVRSTR